MQHQMNQRGQEGNEGEADEGAQVTGIGRERGNALCREQRRQQHLTIGNIRQVIAVGEDARIKINDGVNPERRC